MSFRQHIVALKLQMFAHILCVPALFAYIFCVPALFAYILCVPALFAYAFCVPALFAYVFCAPAFLLSRSNVATFGHLSFPRRVCS